MIAVEDLWGLIEFHATAEMCNERKTVCNGNLSGEFLKNLVKKCSSTKREMRQLQGKLNRQFSHM